MYRWFSNAAGRRWDPSDGYSALFAQQIRVLRDWFGLQKRGGGQEQGTEKWILYRLQHTDDVFVTIDDLDWTGYERYDGYDTPVLRFRVRMARAIETQGVRRSFFSALFGREQEGTFARGPVFIDVPLVMEFPAQFPEEPPRFRIDERRYRNASASHEHHMWNDGWFCIFAGHGDWSRDRGTAVSALGVAFDWMAWHYNTHGW